MSVGDITTLLRQGILHVLLLAGPMLIPALVVGLIVAILQASTSIQEQTLTFVPKIVVILLMLALLGGWMFSTLGQYTINLFSQIQNMAR
jgi:flagellar biosynthetic protein FliQ